MFGTLFPFTVISALTFSTWSPVRLAGQSLDYWIEYLPNQVMLPVGGLLIATFVAWRLAPDISANELNFANPIAFSVWARLMRFVVVPAVFVILFTGL